jgi:enolase
LRAWHKIFCEQVDYLAELVAKYPIISIEDGWMKMTGMDENAN